MSIKEMVFLSLASNLPGLAVSDRIRNFLLRLAGMRIDRGAW